MKRTVMLADCQSFYATVEKVARPEYANLPLVVAGDPSRRSGIILAACPLAKRFGVSTAETLGEALAKCPDAIVVQPRMEQYIKVSMQITAIYQQYSDLVEPYSIDEQHIDVTGVLAHYDSAEQLALHIQQHVLRETGVRTRFGIGENKVLSKMACDHFAKKNELGVFTLDKANLQSTLWPLPIGKMFMVGRRMKKHLTRLGIETIGQLAQSPLHSLSKRWGINGEMLWRIANGIDDSPVSPLTHHVQKGIGHHMTLPRDYETLEQIKVPLLELTELVCQRARLKGYMGSTLSVSSRGADFDFPTGFHRQRKLDEPSYLVEELYPIVYELFEQYWDGQPVRSLGISLTQLVPDDVYALSLLSDREQKIQLARATDYIRERYGQLAIVRASSLTEAGQFIERSHKIGGHYK